MYCYSYVWSGVDAETLQPEPGRRRVSPPTTGVCERGRRARSVSKPLSPPERSLTQHSRLSKAIVSLSQTPGPDVVGWLAGRPLR